MLIEDLGRLDYRAAWAVQEKTHADVLDGGAERILFVEHPPVITLGRRGGGDRFIRASADELRRLGVEVVQTDRGGDVTYHAPGQVVAYPIVRLIDHRLSVGSYVHSLERAVVATLAGFGIEANTDPSAVGVWAGDAKVCALGVRIKRGVSLHGIALNVETDLAGFDLIVPCGLSDRRVTSMRHLLAGATPPADEVKRRLGIEIARALEAGTG